MGFSLSDLFKKKTSEERRESPRYKKVFIAQCEDNGKKSFSTVVDISKAGLGIYLEKQVDIGTTLKVTLQHEFVNGAYSSQLVNITLPATVIWVKEEFPPEAIKSPEARDKQFRAGLELGPLDSDTEKKYLAIVSAVENS